MKGEKKTVGGTLRELAEARGSTWGKGERQERGRQSYNFLQIDGTQQDWSRAYKEKAGIQTVWANAAKMPPEAWYEIYVEPWHPELARLAARVGMRVLSQVSLASSCERNWSAHGHTHTQIQSRLDPATAQRVDRPAGRQLLTEKLVYVYSNSQLVASTRDSRC